MFWAMYIGKYQRRSQLVRCWQSIMPLGSWKSEQNIFSPIWGSTTCRPLLQESMIEILSVVGRLACPHKQQLVTRLPRLLGLASTLLCCWRSQPQPTPSYNNRTALLLIMLWSVGQCIFDNAFRKRLLKKNVLHTTALLLLCMKSSCFTSQDVGTLSWEENLVIAQITSPPYPKFGQLV